MKYKDSNNEWQELVVKASDTLPIGFIGISPSETIPYGWLLCDGSEVSRTSYADLFKVIGTSYGAGNGSTTFNLPNLKGRIPVGLDASQTEFDTLGETGGSKYIQQHNHGKEMKWASSGDMYGYTDAIHYSGAYSTNVSYVNSGNVSDVSTGDSGNLPPYIVQNYIIKAKQSTAVVAQAVNEYTTGNDKVYDVDYINELNTYSTEETFTGKYWIDGKKIYKKTISFNASSTEIYINTGIPNSSIDNMWIARPSYCIESNGLYFYNLDGSFYKSNGDWLSARINCDYGDTAKVELKSDSVSRIEKGYVTIEYTKTTD